MLKSALAAIFLLVPALAHAQAVCAPRSEIAEFLLVEYGEILAHQGLTESGLLMEIFVAPQANIRGPSVPHPGSWTAIITQPDGKSCLMVSGGGWATMAAGSPI